MEEIRELLRLVPAPPDWRIPWEDLGRTGWSRYFTGLERVPQDPVHHGEGDVWTHTRMTCEALAGLAAFRALESRDREALFLAALLHDVGKLRCTRQAEGRWTAPHHAAVGAAMVREALWLEWGCCGDPERQALRETVCALIRYHSLPPHAAFEADGALRLLRAASNGALVPRFRMELLCLLSEADILGRMCPDRQELLEAVALCGALAEELGCLTGPRAFPDAHTARACLSGRMPPADYALYDDAWGEVTLLSGLPGTGKDAWIAGHCPELPVVSLDGIRGELGISPEGAQGRVVETARERARELLRARRPFVWNATCLTPEIRQRQIGLFESYGASVRVVYLETGWEEQLRRNRDREAVVPEAVIGRMLAKLTPPERFEARGVEWRCI